MPHKMYLSSFHKSVMDGYKSRCPDSELNVLLSFGTRSSDYTDLIASKDINSLALDSGAFTKNFSKNDKTENITLDGFIAFCRWVKDRFELIFNYDEDFKMDGFETNLMNMREIEKAGIRVVPVAHDFLGEKVPEIDFYIKQKYPVIALGYSKHKKTNGFNNIKTAVDKIVDAGLKVHLLGIASCDIIGKLPIHYSDSTSWTKEGMFGNVLWWNPDNCSEDKTDRILFLDKENSHEIHEQHIGNYIWIKQFEDYLMTELQFEINDLYGHDKNLNRQIANVHHFLKLQSIIREMHNSRGFNI